MKSLFEVKKIKNDDTIDTKYSNKIMIPHYIPSDKSPNILELCDTSKYLELCSAINKSNLSEDNKKFLRLAASRHIVFNYAKIADYYAHSDVEMQRLMERSALVIIDIKDAIAEGYVRVSKNIEAIMKESGEKAK